MFLDKQNLYPWHENVWQILTERFPNIGHGLLFYGREGCGQFEFTHHFVAWVLCLNRQPHASCGHCASCQWLQANTHPNYIHIGLEGDHKKANAKIKIEQIREILPFLQQTVDGWRIVVIDPAESLNIAASNALLKTLEEPNEKTLIILLAAHYLKLPATIRSRLQHFALDRLDSQQLNLFLAQKLPNLNAVQQQVLVNLANQMPLQVLKLAEKEWVQLRAEFLLDWKKLVSQKNQPLTLSTKWSKTLSLNDFLCLFEYLLADVIAYHLKQPIKNIDLNLDEISGEYSLENLFDFYAQLQKIKQMSEQNVQSNLMLDQLFMQLMKI